jgi:hypothetical protein
MEKRIAIFFHAFLESFHLIIFEIEQLELTYKVMPFEETPILKVSVNILLVNI